MTARSAAAAVALGLFVCSGPASAHDVGVGVLSAVETAPGTYAYAWTPPADALAAPAEVTIRFPEHCTRHAATLTCGRRGLHGVIAFDGVHDARMQILVVVRPLDGPVIERLATGEAPSVDLGEGSARSALGWVRVGIEHILGGLDHLAFVLGMILVVGAAPRRLAATLSAFTIAHSATLALALLDVVRVAPAPVEATIAASVVLLAREALGEDATWTRQRPWWVAGGFGLVHGLGFAGALRELSLPRGSLGFALGFFNLGIELGQVMIVAAVLLLWRAGRRWELSRRLHAPTAYVLGGLGACWFMDRAAAILR